MSEPAEKRRATYQDLLTVPEDRLAQIVDGELVTNPRPTLAHARAASVLGMDIGGPYERGRDGPGGWWILYEPELHLHSDILVPDLAGWRRASMPRPPAGNYCEEPPDWVCEILSPSTASMDRVKKMPVYAREGVSHAWVIDPDAQTLEVLRLTGEHWLVVATHNGTERIRAEPFDETELDLSALWIPRAR